jgi:hypothetical protein
MKTLSFILLFSFGCFASVRSEMAENGDAVHALTYSSGERIFLGDLAAPKSAKATATMKEVLDLARRIFVGTQLARMTLFEDRDGGKISADAFREVRGEGVLEKEGRIVVRLKNVFSSKTFPTDPAGKRLPTNARTEREYLNVYEFWQDADSGEWVGYMRTEGDSAREKSTRGVTTGKLAITAEDCLIWDSAGVQPTYYQGAGSKKKPGMGLTRSQWCFDSRTLMRRTDSVTWEVDSKSHKTTGVVLNRFKNLASTGRLALDPPAASHWEVLTDGTERKGPTTASVVTATGGIRFRGSLGLIEGKDKTAVAFAIARIPAIFNSSATEFYVKGKQSPTELRASALIRTKNRYIKGIPGVLSYHAPLTFGVDPAQVKVSFSSFEPYVRGTKVAAGLAPALRPEEVEDFAILVRRSDQPTSLNTKNPLDFEIDILSAEE